MPFCGEKNNKKNNSILKITTGGFLLFLLQFFIFIGFVILQANI